LRPHPLYRQSQIFARRGVDLARSTLAGWVGGACWWLEALHDRLCKDVFASDHLFADDTPVPVLDPGRGHTKTGRLWVYARNQRSWGGPAPPAAIYLFAPDRKAERPAAHLEHFKGVLHVDGYAGFERRSSAASLARCSAVWSSRRLKGGEGVALGECRVQPRDRELGGDEIAPQVAQLRPADRRVELDQYIARLDALGRPAHEWRGRSRTAARAWCGRWKRFCPAPRR
jgi:transposase IS66 family protein